MKSPFFLKICFPAGAAMIAAVLFCWLVLWEGRPGAEDSAGIPGLEKGEATSGQPGTDGAGTPEFLLAGAGAPVTARAGAAPRDSETTVFEAFARWRARYEATPPARRGALAEVGRGLAGERRQVMKRLIREDPEEALLRALAPEEREGLPESVAGSLEEWVGGPGDLEVYGVTAAAEDSGGRHRFVRYVRIGEDRYEAFVYGRRLEQPSGPDAGLHGVALEGRLALHENPLRLMGAGEPIDPALPAYRVDCAEADFAEVSDAPARVAPEEVAAVSRDEVFLLCGEGACGTDHFMALSDDYLVDVDDDRMPRPYETRGNKRVLVMRVAFEPEDDEGEAVAAPSEEAIISGTGEVNDFLRANSFQQFAFTTIHITEVLTLTDDGELDPGAVLSAARAAARDAGYGSDYEFDVVASGDLAGMPAGFGMLGGKGAWVLGDFNPGVLAHELGHNFGLFHSWYWEPVGPVGGYPMENARTIELGNPFDIMTGAEAFPRNHFNANFKYLLRWLPELRMHQVPGGTSSGSYRLYRLDGGAALESGRHHAIHVLNEDHSDLPDVPVQDYWIEFRRLFEENERASEGVLISWGDEGSRTGNHLLNANPDVFREGGLPVAAEDAPLRIGETYSDPVTPLHITPLERGGASPHDYIDVAVTRGVLEVEVVTPEGEFSIVNPEGDITLPLNEEVLLRAEAWATGSPIGLVEFLVDGHSEGEAEAVDDGFEKRFSFAGFDPGHYELRARVRNEAGNEVTSAPLSIEVVAPVPRVELRVSRKELVLGQELELSVVDLDDGGFFSMTEVAFFAEGESIGSRGAEPFVLGWTPETQGDHLLHAVVTFDSGDVVQSDFVQIFVSDTDVVPELPLVFSWFSRESETDADLFGISHDGERLLAVGASGTLLVSGEGGEWSPETTGASEHLRGMRYASGLYVVVGDTGTILESSDTAEWLEVDSQTIRALRAVAFGNGRFVAVGDDGRIRLRQEDETWRVRFAGDFISLHGVAYGAGRFVAVGEGGNVFTSPDGMDWTRRDTPTSGSLYAVVFGDGRFVAVGDGAVVLTSPDGESWTEQDTGTDETLREVHFGGQVFVAAGSAGTLITSEDGESWNPNASGVVTSLEGVALAGTTFVVVGREGVVLQSGQSGYANWLTVHHPSGDFTDPAIVGPLADPGAMGIPNILRFALGLPAHSPDRDQLPQTGILHDEDSGNDYLTIEFTRRTDTGDAVLHVEVSPDLTEWELLGEEAVIEIDSGEAIETVTVRDSVPMDGAGSRFMRLRVELME